MELREEKYLLSSAYHTIQILDILREDRILTVSEISRRMGINKTSVFRYLYTLEAGGYIYKTNNAKYMLGRKLIRIGEEVEERRTQYSLAQQEIDRLRERFGEAAYLTRLLPDLRQVVEVKSVSANMLRVKRRESVNIPVEKTASGKVLLAGFLGTEREKELWKFPGIIPELKATLERGYGMEEEEVEEDFSGIAVPLRTMEGEAVAAISFVGPTFRFAEHREELITGLRQQAAEIEKLLAL